MAADLNRIVAGVDLRILQEPLGFIKVLEWVFAIFSFATCGGYSGSMGINVYCPPLPNKSDAINTTEIINFGYPFRLNLLSFKLKNCSGSKPEIIHLVGDFSPSAEFYVTLAVFAFLYCMAALVIYIFYQDKYKENRGPLIDFWVTAIFFFLWLVSSSGWAKGLADVKASLAMDFIMKLIPACRSPGFNCVVEGLAMSRLNVSVVFGFLNFILWGGNLWFAYKETPWHSSPPLTAPSQPSQGQPARGVSSTPSFGS